MSNRNWITVVSGLPRSGTSLMMQALAAGGIEPFSDHARLADSDNPRGYYELEAVKKTKLDSSWLPNGVGKAVKVIHLLIYDLPDGYDYRVLLMKRKIEEVLASQRKMLERLGRPGAAVKPGQLAAIFQKQIEQVETYMAGKPNFAVLGVDYNRMVADPAPEIAAINGFLGGDLEMEAMTRAVDPTLYRNKQ